MGNDGKKRYSRGGSGTPGSVYTVTARSGSSSTRQWPLSGAGTSTPRPVATMRRAAAKPAAYSGEGATLWRSTSASVAALMAAVFLSKKHISDQYLPGKAIALVDGAAAWCRMKGKDKVRDDDIMMEIEKMQKM